VQCYEEDYLEEEKGEVTFRDALGREGVVWDGCDEGQKWRVACHPGVGEDGYNGGRIT